MATDPFRPIDRRGFLENLGRLSLGAAAVTSFSTGAAASRQQSAEKTWEPVSDRKVRVGIVGYGVCRFGADFGFQDHPNVEIVAVSDLIPERREGLMQACRCERSYESLEVLVKDPKIEAVFVATDAPNHARHCIEALNHGKHVMTAVPAVWGSIEEAEQLLETVRKTGLKYMMAETVVYSREFLFIKEMVEKGELGKIQHLAASHPQDMDGWPEYWQRMIPMHYATHVVSPCLGLVNGRAEYVSCFGSGTVRDDIAAKSGNRFAVETCHIKIKDSDLTAHIWRFLYDVARQYRESFDVYGTKRSFEWTLIEHEPHVLHTAKKPEPEIPEKVTVPDYAHLLPESIRRFTLPQEIHDAGHLSFIQGGGHGGSHPHLVNEFVGALREDRDPWPNATQSANWTCVGICAHESAVKGGEIVRLPEFTLE